MGGDVKDAVDPLHPEEHPEQLLAARQAADPEVPGKRFGAHIAERDPEPVLLELVRDVEDELVGRAETARALRGSHDDRTRVVEEARPAHGGLDRALEIGDRVRVAPVRARHDVVVVEVAGRDDQVVVVVVATRFLDPASLDVDRRRLGVHEIDAAGLERLSDRERQISSRSAYRTAPRSATG